MTAARSRTPPAPSIIAPCAVHGHQPAVPLVARHDRRDGVLAHPAGQFVVAGHQQDAVGRGQVGVGEDVGGGDDRLVGADAVQPARGRELGQRVVGRGVEQPEPVADLGHVVDRAGAGHDLAVGAQAQDGGAVEHHGQPLGDLGQPAAGERHLHELVVHAGGQRERLPLLGDDGAEDLRHDLVHPDAGRQRQDRQTAPVRLGEDLAGHGRGTLGAAEGEGRGTHRVQPLDEGAAVGRVGRREPGAEDDEDVGTGGGERVRGVVDHHVPDDPAETGGAGGDRRAGQPGQLEGLLDGQTHALLPAGAVVPSGLGAATRRQPSYAGTEQSRYGV